MNDAFITFIYVADLGRSDAFYRTALGLDLVTSQEVCNIYRASDSGYLGLCTHRPPTEPGSVILTLVRHDVESFCQRLVSDGVVFERRPTHNARFGITHAFLRDPDGNLVEIQRFDDESWAEPID